MSINTEVKPRSVLRKMSDFFKNHYEELLSALFFISTATLAVLLACGTIHLSF
jgi:hypothetical protein